MEPVTLQTRFLSAKDISSILGITLRYAQMLMREMPCIDIGHGSKSLLRISEADFNMWLKSLNPENKSDAALVLTTKKPVQKRTTGQELTHSWESTVKIPKR